MSAKTSAILPSHAAVASSSLIFSATVYGSLTGLFGIPVPLAGFAAVLVLQALILLLGRHILTSLGGCMLSVLFALAGFGFLTHLLVREGLALPAIGLAGAGIGVGTAVILIAFGFAGALRSGATPRGDEPAQEEEGHPGGATDIEAPKVPIFEDAPPDAGLRAQEVEKTWTRPEDAGEHEFDFLRPGTGAQIDREPAEPEEDHPTLDDEALRLVEDAFLVSEPRDEVGAALEDIARLDADTGGDAHRTEIPETWADQAARELVGNATASPSRELALADKADPGPASSEEPQQEAPFLQQDSEQLAMAPVRRPKFRVVRAASGETLRTFHCDAGYSSLDLAGLQALLTLELHGMEPKIVGLNWFDLDLVEILVEEAVTEPSQATPPPSPKVDAPGPQPGPMRYFIYDRKSFTLAGEYVPEGRFPRLDRLTLHRILPQYDFRTFVIEAIRWVGPGEVRIYVRGDEKGKAAQPAVQKPAGGEPIAAKPRRRGPAV